MAGIVKIEFQFRVEKAEKSPVFSNGAYFSSILIFEPFFNRSEGFNTI
jgi:hypothetical protein